MKFKTIDVKMPKHDCDVVLTFTSGKRITLQARPGNADIDYNGSFDIILPDDQVVTCWRGDDMEPAKRVGKHEHERKAKQLVIELP